MDAGMLASPRRWPSAPAFLQSGADGGGLQIDLNTALKAEPRPAV
jgi:hypothetical protein